MISSDDLVRCGTGVPQKGVYKSSVGCNRFGQRLLFSFPSPDLAAKCQRARPSRLQCHSARRVNHNNTRTPCSRNGRRRYYRAHLIHVGASLVTKQNRKEQHWSGFWFGDFLFSHTQNLRMWQRTSARSAGAIGMGMKGLSYFFLMHT